MNSEQEQANAQEETLPNTQPHEGALQDALLENQRLKGQIQAMNTAKAPKPEVSSPAPEAPSNPANDKIDVLQDQMNRIELTQMGVEDSTKEVVLSIAKEKGLTMRDALTFHRGMAPQDNSAEGTPSTELPNDEQKPKPATREDAVKHLENEITGGGQNFSSGNQ